jgi:YD repeat-containing protein
VKLQNLLSLAAFLFFAAFISACSSGGDDPAPAQSGPCQFKEIRFYTQGAADSLTSKIKYTISNNQITGTVSVVKGSDDSTIATINYSGNRAVLALNRRYTLNGTLKSTATTEYQYDAAGRIIRMTSRTRQGGTTKTTINSLMYQSSARAIGVNIDSSSTGIKVDSSLEDLDASGKVIKTYERQILLNGSRRWFPSGWYTYGANNLVTKYEVPAVNIDSTRRVTSLEFTWQAFTRPASFVVFDPFVAFGRLNLAFVSDHVITSGSFLVSEYKLFDNPFVVLRQAPIYDANGCLKNVFTTQTFLGVTTNHRTEFVY